MAQPAAWVKYATDWAGSHAGHASMGVSKDRPPRRWSPSARPYLDVDLFCRRGIAVRWMDYSGQRPYPQHGASSRTWASSISSATPDGAREFLPALAW